MSTTYYHTRELDQAAAAAGGVSGFFKKCWSAIQQWRERERVRTALYDLSDRDLRDIGITRGEIEYFARSATSDDPRR